MRLATHMTRPAAPPLVLLVDDNPDTLEMYSLGLKYEGFEVRRAVDGEKALVQVATERPDCIVTDVRMPRMTGLEFRRVLSRDTNTAEIPVIALTAMGTTAEIETAKAAGFNSVLLKPCLPEHLAREIVRVLAFARKTRAKAAEVTSRSTQLLAKAARLQQKNADMAERHKAVRAELGRREPGKNRGSR